MRRVIAVLAMVGLALIAVSAATAQPTLQVRGVESQWGPGLNDWWSGTCGFDVVAEGGGVRDSTMVYGEGGLIVRQIDRYDVWVRFTAPSTDISIVAKGKGVSEMTYPEGATIGAPVNVTITGTNEQFPGIAPDAGHSVFAGQVTGFDDYGVPQWDGPYGGATLVSQVGTYLTRQPFINAQICAALRGD